MDNVSVIKIVDAEAKSGVSSKTNKPWSMSHVELSNKESAFIFNPIDIGDVVEVVQNGDYKNWQKVKVDPKHEEIMKALRAIYKVVSVGETPTPVKQDTIHPVPDGEPVSLEDIPF